MYVNYVFTYLCDGTADFKRLGGRDKQGLPMLESLFGDDCCVVSSPTCYLDPSYRILCLCVWQEEKIWWPQLTANGRALEVNDLKMWPCAAPRMIEHSPCRDVMQDSFACEAFLGCMSRLRKHAQLAERIVCEESKRPSKPAVLGRQEGVFLT